MGSIAENVEIIKEKIACAAAASGRSEKDILLIAASKMNSAERVREAFDAGIKAFGENKVQELLEKDLCNAYDGAEVHMIGHLQRNKVKKVVGRVQLIHSVDSVELMAEIDRCAKALGIKQDILLEVNIGEEESKSGFSPEEIPGALSAAAGLDGIFIRGLMAIPPACSTPDENIPFFTSMNELFVDNRVKKYDNVRMDFLSMGMSGDFEAAIACGSNMVRIGSAIFGPRNYSRTEENENGLHG